ncbi:MAG: SHOCT domain-containing protein, partial [Zestosphaera sp.]
PTYGLPLLLAIQKGDEDKVLEIVKTVEIMRALGRSPAAGWMGALIAMPGLLQPVVQQQAQPQPQQAPPAPPQQPQRETPIVEKLRELKEMLDEGLITQEEYESMKKELLEKYKQEM